LKQSKGSPESLVIGVAYHQNKINIPGILFEMKESLTLPFHRQAGRIDRNNGLNSLHPTPYFSLLTQAGEPEITRQDSAHGGVNACFAMGILRSYPFLKYECFNPAGGCRVLF
jgi:hypothetical protein